MRAYSPETICFCPHFFSSFPISLLTLFCFLPHQCPGLYLRRVGPGGHILALQGLKDYRSTKPNDSMSEDLNLLLFSATYKKKKYVVISPAEVKVISVSLNVCTGPRKGEKKKEKRKTELWKGLRANPHMHPDPRG